MTYRNLINTDGTVNISVLMRIAHANAKRMIRATYAQSLQAEMLLLWSSAKALGEEWRWRNGFYVKMAEINAYSPDSDGVRASRF